MRFITVLFLLATSFCYAQWTPYNVNMEVKGKFQADKGIYFKQGADSGKVWMCIDDSAGLGEWRTISGGGSTIDTSNFWNINGNSGTTAGTNFIGTTDSVGFRIENSSNEVGLGLQSIKISGHGLNDALGIVIVGESENEEGIFIDGYSASKTSVKINGYTDGASPDWSDIEINAQTGKLKITGINEGAGKVLTSDANGLGSWQAESMTLISTVTASNSATVDFTGLDSGSYVIFYTNVIPSTNSTTLNFRYGTGGTPTYQTSSYVYSISFNLNTGTSITTSNSTSASSFVLHGVTTGTGQGVSGVLTMLNPSGTSIYHPMTFTANDFNAGNNYYFTGGGCWKSTTAVTAGRFLFSSGNIASGTFKIYKIK